jgi:protein SCO1/2
MMYETLEGHSTRFAAGLTIRRAFRSLPVKCFCCGLLLLCALTVRPQDKSSTSMSMHGMHKEQPQEKSLQKQIQRLAIPDVEILDEQGQKKKFYADLVKGKIVIINFVYTTCKDICPLSGENFARLQTLLGERLGKEVYLLSISTDPETDSPPKLKAWSERFKPKAGWTFVTGEKMPMQALLHALTGEGARRGFHTPVALLINDESGAWVRTYGLESPKRLTQILDELAPPVN